MWYSRYKEKKLEYKISYMQALNKRQFPCICSRIPQIHYESILQDKNRKHLHRVLKYTKKANEFFVHFSDAVAVVAIKNEGFFTGMFFSCL